MAENENRDLKNRDLKDDLFELICFMLSSARGLMDEPKAYGPFRIIDSVSRLISILEKHQLADDFLVREKKKIEEGKYSVMDGEDKFREFLDGLMVDFAEELKKR
ncbi:MAG: hypothetical protein H0Z28_06880 [Archaeoglobus sp.]|nr:hypothetical protein [Archaeoglobus sp.]